MDQIQLGPQSDDDRKHKTLKSPLGLQPHIQRILSRVHDGVELKGYQVGEIVGIGSHGVVFKGIHQESGVDVAIKIFRLSERAKQAGHFGRFRELILRLSKLDHPSLVQVYETGYWNDLHYVAMDLFMGPMDEPMNLMQYARLFNSIVEEAVLQTIFLHLLDALHCLHSHGFIHCNLKPSNILFKYKGEPDQDPQGYWRVELKLGDFGVTQLVGEQEFQSSLKEATRVHDTERLEAADTIAMLQTIEYLCPTLLQGNAPTVQSDLFAAGRLLCMLLTGAVSPGMAPTEIRSGINPGWDEIVQLSTAPNPADRYPSAEHMAAAIESLTL